jgi:hypothetical protein
LSAAQDVKMEVIDRLTAVATAIDDDAVAVGQA